MAIDAALVGSKFSGNGTLTTTGGATTTGNTFVIAISYDAGAVRSTALSALDNKGNTYTQAGTTLSANGAKKELFYCQNGTGGAGHTAAAAFNTSSFGTIYLIEITGALAASFDLSTQGTDASSTFGVATGVLTQADEVIITLIGNGDANNPMNYASSNMTELAEEGDGSSFWTSAIYKQVVAATTSFTPAITSASTGTHATINATFKASGGGGGGIIVNPFTGRIAQPLIN